jgi:hypothetical protein
MNETFINAPVVPSKNAIALRYGIICGIITIVYSLILNITELALTNQILGWISFLIVIAAIVMAMREFKKQNQGFMSYGQGLSIGTIVVLVSSILGGIFTYLYVTLIDTGYIEKMRNMQVTELENKGMSDDQIDQAMLITDKMMTPSMIPLMAILGGVIFGFLLSLIIAAIVKHNRPEFE